MHSVCILVTRASVVRRTGREMKEEESAHIDSCCWYFGTEVWKDRNGKGKEEEEGGFCMLLLGRT
jgi:hypothetical protein